MVTKATDMILKVKQAKDRDMSQGDVTARNTWV